MTFLEQCWVRWFVLTRWSYWFIQANAVVPLAYRSRDRWILNQSTVDLLNQVQGLERPEAVILRQAFPAPWQIASRLRESIKAQKISHSWVQQAMKRAVCIMGNIGYVPLADRYNDGTPNYIFHAKGIEETRDLASLQGRVAPNQPHKLYFQPATVLPHLPYGPGLESGRFDSAIAPDVVVFIFMDQARDRTKLGPLLYFLRRLETVLGEENLALLKEKIFRIIPDQDIRGNPFGGADGVSLFGEVPETRQKFMRFDYARLEPVPSTPQRDRARSAIAALKRVLDVKEGRRFVEHAPLQPGDLLIVNNWRVATAWHEECAGLAGRGGRHVHHGDRVVFQMNFYRPRDEVREKYDDDDDEDAHSH